MRAIKTRMARAGKERVRCGNGDCLRARPWDPITGRFSRVGHPWIWLFSPGLSFSFFFFLWPFSSFFFSFHFLTGCMTSLNHHPCSTLFAANQGRVPPPAAEAKTRIHPLSRTQRLRVMESVSIARRTLLELLGGVAAGVW